MSCLNSFSFFYIVCILNVVNLSVITQWLIVTAIAIFIYCFVLGDLHLLLLWLPKHSTEWSSQKELLCDFCLMSLFIGPVFGNFDISNCTAPTNFNFTRYLPYMDLIGLKFSTPNHRNLILNLNVTNCLKVFSPGPKRAGLILTRHQQNLILWRTEQRTEFTFTTGCCTCMNQGFDWRLELGLWK